MRGKLGREDEWMNGFSYGSVSLRMVTTLPPNLRDQVWHLALGLASNKQVTSKCSKEMALAMALAHWHNRHDHRRWGIGGRNKCRSKRVAERSAWSRTQEARRLSCVRHGMEEGDGFRLCSIRYL